MRKKSQNILTDSKLAAQIIFILIVVGGVIMLDQFSGTDPGSLENSSVTEASLYFDFNDMKRMFQGEVIDGMTILDALNAAVIAGNIDINYTVDAENNTDLSKINEHDRTEDKNFYFFVNNSEIPVHDLNKTPVRPGDKIRVTLK